ncbi:putative sigma-54 specific transcriptional regulator [Escherichia coli]|uniref:Putative sigma-54 specific transcriptional regulator n=1 Tax=Escherichia coli TaxID=562 RepID=A0A377FAH2_ECOLX|nr:putative sigma-54 specific transcriptional regulator [Escherichia coli]
MSELIATAASSINAFTLAKRVAAFNVPVLIQGETGAGKECVAKYIHTVAFGENDNAPYIGVNCAAIRKTCWKLHYLATTKAHLPAQLPVCQEKWNWRITDLITR